MVGGRIFARAEPVTRPLSTKGRRRPMNLQAIPVFARQGVVTPRRSSITPPLSEEAKVVTPTTAHPIYRRVRPSLTMEARFQTLLQLAKLLFLAVLAMRP